MAGQSLNFFRAEAFASVQPPWANRTVQPSAAVLPGDGLELDRDLAGCCGSWPG
jgi:hypothetical protein